MHALGSLTDEATADRAAPAAVDLAASYRCCRQIARRSASNFYYSFLLLPRAKRDAMCALYAFLRRTDDLSDGPAAGDAAAAALRQWRTSLAAALGGQFDDPLLPALVDTVRRYQIPTSYLEDVIAGVEMDLTHAGFDTWGELEVYCHHVASVVGLACIHIWGFSGPQALAPARCCGLAFQLTNILRDLGEDAGRGRIYLPREDLRRFDYSADDLRRGLCDERSRALIHFEIARTECFYADAAELGRWLHPDGRRIFAAMVATYRGLLDEIKRRDGDVWTERIRLPRWRKARIAARCVLACLQPAARGVRPGADS